MPPRLTARPTLRGVPAEPSQALSTAVPLQQVMLLASTAAQMRPEAQTALLTIHARPLQWPYG